MEKRVLAGGGVKAATNIRFGPYELNLRAGELLKEGHRIRLQEQPFQILRMLLESPGEVVSRDEIRRRLWPDDTVVEFDHSINAAVKRLRDVLRESADKPRYIETVARRGYRFMGVVDPVNPPPATPEPLSAPNPAPRRPSLRLTHTRLLLPAILATLILLAGAAGWHFVAGARPFAPSLQPLVRLDVELEHDEALKADTESSEILSPDGTRMVYTSRSKLFTLRLDNSARTELASTENAKAPFFSPDSKWIAFFSEGKLKKIRAEGGPVVDLCRVSLRNGGSWGDDGNIVAVEAFVLALVPSAGGDPTALTALAPGEIAHRWPQVLPGSKAVLFTAYSSLTGSETANIEVVSLADHRRKTLVRGGTFGRYAPTGHLLYVNKGTLLAVPFDVNRLEVRGTPMPVLEGVAYNAAWGSAQFDFSTNGTLVYRSASTGSGMVTVQNVDAAGRSNAVVPVPGNYLSPTISPDGSRVALTSAGDIWVYELHQGAMTRLTFGGGYGNPLWSSDGRYIVFRAARGIFCTRADASGQPHPVLLSSNQQVPWSFTADGKRLAFVETNPATGADLWTVPVESDNSGLRAGKPELFLQTPFDERTPMISPDGRWLAYMSNESGRTQVYVQAFPVKNGGLRISEDQGAYPAWSRDSHELFFWRLGTDPRLMVVPYKVQGGSFLPETPRVWSDRRLVSFSTTRSYDPLPDGRNIIALMPADTPEPPRDSVTFLVNFFDELRRRVPVAPN